MAVPQFGVPRRDREQFLSGCDLPQATDQKLRCGILGNDAECSSRNGGHPGGSFERRREKNDSRARVLRVDRCEYRESAHGRQRQVEQRQVRRQVAYGFDARRPVSAGRNNFKFALGAQYAAQPAQNEGMAVCDDNTDTTRAHLWYLPTTMILAFVAFLPTALSDYAERPRDHMLLCEHNKRLTGYNYAIDKPFRESRDDREKWPGGCDNMQKRPPSATLKTHRFASRWSGC